MNYTVLFVIMAIVFLVAIGIIYTDIMAIREEIETIHKLDMKLMQKLHDSQCTIDQGWTASMDGWKQTLDVCDNLLADLKQVTESLVELRRTTERRE